MSLALAQLLPEFDMPARARVVPDAMPQPKREPEKRNDPDPALIEAIREEARAEGRMEAERELGRKPAAGCARGRKRQMSCGERDVQTATRSRTWARISDLEVHFRLGDSLLAHRNAPFC